MSRRNPLFVLVALVLASGASTAAVRHLGAHVHGQATVDIAVDQSHLQVGLHLPGHDAVGFEHPPASAAERKAFDHAMAVLKAGRWIEPSREASCRLRKADVSAPGLEGEATGGHADMQATYDFDCASAVKLAAVDLRLVEAFPSVQRIVADVISAQGSAEQVLEHGVVRVDIAP